MDKKEWRFGPIFSDWYDENVLGVGRNRTSLPPRTRLKARLLGEITI
jgi:hypothetical protein